MEDVEVDGDLGELPERLEVETVPPAVGPAIALVDMAGRNLARIPLFCPEDALVNRAQAGREAGAESLQGAWLVT